jgi:hypothetical protein
MTPTLVPVSQANTVAGDAFLAAPEAAKIDAKNGNLIGPIDYDAWDRALVEVTNTSNKVATITLRGGVLIHGGRMSDVSCQVPPAGGVCYVSPLRDLYRQPDGSIELAYSTGTTGTVRVLVLPAPCPSV